MRVHDGEPIGQALRRFKKQVEFARHFEKWHRRAKWNGVFVKPSEIRGVKKFMKKVKARQGTTRAKCDTR